MRISEQVARLEAERDVLQARIDVETWTRADGSTNPRWGTSKDRRKA